MSGGLAAAGVGVQAAVVCVGAGLDGGWGVVVEMGDGLPAAEALLLVPERSAVLVEGCI